MDHLMSEQKREDRNIDWVVVRTAIVTSIFGAMIGSILTWMLGLPQAIAYSIVKSGIIEYYNQEVKFMSSIPINTKGLSSSDRPLLVTATCSEIDSGHIGRKLNGYVYSSNPEQIVNGIAGGSNISITFLVPPRTGYYVQVHIADKDMIERGDNCSAQAWTL